MSHTHYKICPECQTRAALAAPYCLTCRRKYNTRFLPTRAMQTLRLPFTAVITAPTKKEAVAVAQIFGVLLLAAGVLCATNARPAAENNEHPGFVCAGDGLWTGEQLYFSAGRAQTPKPVFVILGGNARYVPPNGRAFDGVKVRYARGGEAWKPREPIACSGCYFVKNDDPALARKQWHTYTH